MAEIHALPTYELKNDLIAAKADLLVAKKLFTLERDVRDRRIRGNERVIEVIEAELKRRENANSSGSA